MNHRTLSELVGILIITGLGTGLHYAYAWSGEQWWVATFAATNESVWEHLKLAFWPAFLFSIFVWPLYGQETANFWVGRAAALIAMPVAIAVGFYAYTAALGYHSLPLDLVLFVGSIALGQALALLIYALPDMGRAVKRVGLTVIGLQAVAFAILTFLDLPFPLFIEM